MNQLKTLLRAERLTNDQIQDVIGVIENSYPNIVSALGSEPLNDKLAESFWAWLLTEVKKGSPEGRVMANLIASAVKPVPKTEMDRQIVSTKNVVSLFEGTRNGEVHKRGDKGTRSRTI